MSVMQELEKDFRHLVSCVDFDGYDPFSKDFMRACLVGQMLATMKILEDDVDEELDGAKKYYETYLETGDNSYKDMANDELRHAGILIKKHLAEPHDDAVKEKMNSLERERQDMMRKMSQAAIPATK